MTTLSDALQEAYASVPDGVVAIDTLTIEHEILSTPIYITNQREALTAKLENGNEVIFLPVAFQFSLPTTGDNGRQEISITIDNVSRILSDFINTIKETQTPVKIIYRPYLWPAYNTPQMDPPLELTLNDISIDLYKISGKATFADLVNMKFPSEYYNRTRFPSLGY